MKRLLMGCACALAIHSTLLVAAQGSKAADAVAAVDKSWAENYLGCNVKAWDELLAEDLTFIHNSGMIDDKAKQMASVKACGLESLQSEVTKVRLYGDNTAVVLGAMKGKVKGRDFRFDLLYSRVYIKQKGAWRLVSHQSTDAPKKAS
jgi:ketosteroid isomerase-like protein